LSAGNPFLTFSVDTTATILCKMIFRSKEKREKGTDKFLSLNILNVLPFSSRFENFGWLLRTFVLLPHVLGEEIPFHYVESIFEKRLKDEKV
jgi:hypothetical protein